MDNQTISQRLLGTVPDNLMQLQRECLLSDLRVGHKAIFLKDEQLSDHTVKTVLSEIGISKSTWLNSALDPNEWVEVMNLLSKGNKKTYRLMAYNDKLHGMTTKSIKGVTVDMEKMVQALDSVDFKNLVPSNFRHDPFSGNLAFDLLDPEGIEILCDDIWKVGYRVNINLDGFSISMLYHRLVCSNGAIRKIPGASSTIKSKSLSPQLFQRMMTKCMETPILELQTLIAEKSKIAKATNASVREVMIIKNELDHLLGEAQSLAIDYLDRAYNTDVRLKEKVWQSTADSGIPVYDLVNKATWVSSHDFGLPEQQSLDLSIKATNILFSEVLDMNNVAPKVQIILP